LTSPGGDFSAICRIVESSKATFKFGDIAVTKFFMHPFLAAARNWPRLEKGEEKKFWRCARGFSSHGYWPRRRGGRRAPTKRPNGSLSEEAVYTMDALAGYPRANAHYMDKKDVAQRATPCVSAQYYNCAVSAWIQLAKKNQALCVTLSSRVLLAWRRRSVDLSIAAPTHQR
jgi:hypothetical protein